MPTVETVRGPVDTGDLGTTLMHEHVFVLTPDIMAELRRRVLGRGGPGRRRDRQAAPPARPGRHDDRRPHRRRARPLHPPRRADQRRGRPQHRRRHRASTRSTRSRTSCTTAARTRCSAATSRWSRCSSRTSARASPAPGSRRRSSSASSRSAGLTPDQTRVQHADRRHPRRDRRADHGAHQQRAPDRPARARPVRARRASTSPRSSSGTPGDTNDLDYLTRDHGPRRDDRLRPVRAGPVQPDRAAGRDDRRALRAGVRRPDRARPRRGLLHGLLLRRGRPGRAGPGRAELALRAHPPRRAPRAARAGRERRAAHDDAGREPAAVLLARDRPRAPAPRSGAVRHDGHHPRRRRHRALRPPRRRRWWRWCGRRWSATPTSRRWSRSAASASRTPSCGTARPRVAGGLVADGVTRGDRVASLLPAGLDWVVGFLGTLLAGAVAVPVNTRFAAPEIEHVAHRLRGRRGAAGPGRRCRTGNPEALDGPRPRRPRRDLLHQRHHRPSPRARAPPTATSCPTSRPRSG